MRTSLNGRIAIACDEAACTPPYDDGIGVPTQGVGHTFRAGAPDVRFGGPVWSLERVAEVFTNDLAQYERAVRDGITRPMRQHEFDALVSFCYNVGPGNFAKSSVRKKFNAGGAKAAGPRLRLWNKAGGRVMAGLTERRAEERELLERGRYGDLSKMLLYTRVNSRHRPVGGVLIDPMKLFAADVERGHQTIKVDDALADGMLEAGERGGAVREWQDDLIAAGIDLPFGVDGHFGNATLGATIAFQRREGLIPDGKVGPKTFAAMERALADAAPTVTKPPVDTTAEEQEQDKTAERTVRTARAVRGSVAVEEAAALADDLDKPMAKSKTLRGAVLGFLSTCGAGCMALFRDVLALEWQTQAIIVSVFLLLGFAGAALVGIERLRYALRASLLRQLGLDTEAG